MNYGMTSGEFNEMAAPMGKVDGGDYMDRFRYWPRLCSEAVNIVKTIGSSSDDAHVLAVDWRHEVEQGVALYEHLGIEYTAGGRILPGVELIHDVYTTGKRKKFADGFLPITKIGLSSREGADDLLVVERRIVLPREGSVVGSLFRVMTSEAFKREMRTCRAANSAVRA